MITIISSIASDRSASMVVFVFCHPLILRGLPWRDRLIGSHPRPPLLRMDFRRCSQRLAQVSNLVGMMGTLLTPFASSCKGEYYY